MNQKKKPGTMDLILVIIGVFLFLFVVVMIVVFCLYQTVPDTLVASVFAACGGEFGVMGWIRTTKERTREREWQQADERQRERIKEDDPE